MQFLRPLLALALLAGPAFGQSLRTTTALEAETSNNTSAVQGSPNGNAAPGNVSKLPIRSLLYPGATTTVVVRFMPWFGDKSHRKFGYQSNDEKQLQRQVEDMLSRGIDGAIVDWYGPHQEFKNHVTELLLREGERQGFKVAVSEDAGALKECAKTGCDVTGELISDLKYAADHFEQSPAYLSFNGRPVVTFFGLEKLDIDWNRVRNQLPGNPLLLFRNSGAFELPYSDGAFSWIAPETVHPGDQEGLRYLEHFHEVAGRHPNKFVMGSAYKGFDDSLAGWGKGRKIEQSCGKTWLATFAILSRFYNQHHPLPALIIPTWNDWEEGTEIESGIDSCVSVRASTDGNNLKWDIDGPRETLDHFTVFASTDGKNLARLLDLPAKEHSLNLTKLGLPEGEYSLYVKAVARPSLTNHISNPVTVKVGTTK